MRGTGVARESFTARQVRIEQRTAKVGIIGMGYVGLPLALLYSEQKFAVTGFDVDVEKVKALNQGGSYIVRILPEEVESAREERVCGNGRFRAHRRNGRGHHLRSHAVGRVSRA